ncbi:MAG TPA: trimeric intracellular cation channel family protein [Panacibacter sp.]|nr:trimeric intracellular cation channel family protein [Panacibacter sp.]
MNFLNIIIYTGTFVFAVTGALKARAHHMDIFGATVLAFVTAYGGGTIRDLLIGIRPVNWVNDYLALILVLSAVLIVSIVNKRLIKFKRTIFITDAIGLGLFTAAGIEVSLLHNVNEFYAVVMGVISATFGGLIADILSNTIPDLLKRGELYATASLIGGVIYVLLQHANIEHNIDLAICVVIIVAVRIISKLKRLTLPEI